MSATVSAPPGFRVLLVEDNADAREMLQELLEMWGFQVEVASDGLEAVELALAHKPHVAVLDVGLPGIDGYEVAQQIRERTDDSKLRLVALTGFGGPETRARAEGAGFDIHIVKPVDPDALHRILLSYA